MVSRDNFRLPYDFGACLVATGSFPTCCAVLSARRFRNGADLSACVSSYTDCETSGGGGVTERSPEKCP